MHPVCLVPCSPRCLGREPAKGNDAPLTSILMPTTKNLKRNSELPSPERLPLQMPANLDSRQFICTGPCPMHLTHGKESSIGREQVEFPLVPNRWLIARFNDTQGQAMDGPANYGWSKVTTWPQRNRHDWQNSRSSLWATDVMTITLQEPGCQPSNC